MSLHVKVFRVYQSPLSCWENCQTYLMYDILKTEDLCQSDGTLWAGNCCLGIPNCGIRSWACCWYMLHEDLEWAQVTYQLSDNRWGPLCEPMGSGLSLIIPITEPITLQKCGVTSLTFSSVPISFWPHHKSSTYVTLLISVLCRLLKILKTIFSGIGCKITVMNYLDVYIMFTMLSHPLL